MYQLVVIDVDNSICNCITHLIDWNALGFEITATFANGEDAVAKLKGMSVDAVLIAARLPGITGLETARLIHENIPQCYIVMMNNHKDFDLAKKAMQCGVCDYILKPVDPEELRHSFEILGGKLDTAKQHLHNWQIQASRKSHNEYRGSAELAQRVMAYVDKHILENISLEEVSKQMHISTSHLIRVFKKETGYTFLQYATRKKMEKAAEYFAKENLKVREVSEKLGYHSTRHFSALFYKQFGCYPSEYFDTTNYD